MAKKSMYLVYDNPQDDSPIFCPSFEGAVEIAEDRMSDECRSVFILEVKPIARYAPPPATGWIRTDVS